ncbi:succinylglutamate desuccinylase/aspartoacylase domain-containing protein [Pseudomonas gingeri]|uniref:Succinylglutamate desuccinylase/aspartoacylase family protein n=1 Tax=Pseudomonas gingeri TaxID=117681 RepID=A0A7Y8CMB7_9PSED|nr:succinylglutamate desuccinylase/aspartoacylase family protein [Pseudomonas gingeri]NWA02689.1 succinylglutamate desuccinylase/aspartoacylase family protein [Pseudomonas gingeri]NWA12137.1 succinylglutamate desuccinylase/aspartoacylase family protein [Pseudomonas gingeri]NWA57456.1 succinylglutamate desuccinylase/aspartoacylase family protein [Pseudomonas gingeri]NWA93799.1 succinylglutamate desuccinylase/aspartoacylase family protein [Pseudomonas gingeri]NWB03271.1 succinylglutamate desucci
MKTLEQVRAALKPYPIEVEFPDIRCWKEGTDGVEYVHSFDSGVAGPHVMIMALTHGNEVSGAITVDAFLKRELRPRRGRLTLAFGNVEAYRCFDPRDIDATRYLEEDMNRVWSPDKLAGASDSVELRRARQLQPVIDTVDLLLDIHSMHEEAPPVMMCGARQKGLDFAATLGVPQTVVVDAGHPNGRRLRDYEGFNDPASTRNALLIETGQHFSARSRAVALDTAARFVVTTGTVLKEDVAEFMQPENPLPQRFLEVTCPVVASSMDFTFAEEFRGLEVIEKAGTPIAHDGDTPIVTPHDNCVLIQPSLRHLGIGVTVVRLARILDVVPECLAF